MSRLGAGAFGGKVYEAWTDEQVVPATAFAALEWACLTALFHECQATFVPSRAHQHYLAHLLAEEGSAEYPWM